MRITVDCQGLQSSSSRNRGIGNYCYDFLDSLMSSEQEYLITLLVNGRYSRQRIIDLLEKNLNPKNVTIREWQPLIKSNWIFGNLESRRVSESLYLEVVKSTDPDRFILLSPFEGLDEDLCWAVPEGICTGAIYYDAIPRLFKEKYLSSSTTAEWYADIEKKLEKFHALYPISESSANDALKFLEIESDMVNVIHFGINAEPEGNGIPLSEVDSKMVLAVLGEDERKNKSILLMAWKMLATLNYDLKLKIVYKQSPPEALNNERFLQSNKLSHLVEFLDFVPQAELDALYHSSLFTIFPSLYEGLGLPVLESFKANKPCLVARSSSLTELVNSEEMQFDPLSAEDLVVKITKLICDLRLQEDAIADGKRILNRYSKKSKNRQIVELLNKHCGRDHNSKNKKLIENADGIYFYTILKPTRSGIANFADNLIHPFHSRGTLQIVSDNHPTSSYICPECGLEISVISSHSLLESRNLNYINIHNIGNSIFHTWQIELVGMFPGVVLMHDGYLSGLVWEKLKGSLEIGEFLRIAIQDSCVLNFIDKRMALEPHLVLQEAKLNSYFLEYATSVVVHNVAAAKQIAKDFHFDDVNSLITVPLPVITPKTEYRDHKRKNVIGVFGIIADTKMYESVIQAWNSSETARSGDFTLRFIGEDFSSNFQGLLRSFSKNFNIEYTGYVDPEEYEMQLNQVQFAIQLRRDFRGETSGAIIDLLSRGIPVIANEQPSLEFYPPDSLVLLPKPFSTFDLSRKIDWTISNIELALSGASKARQHLLENASSESCANQILGQAELTRSKINFMPLLQLEILLDKMDCRKNEDTFLNTVADICLESFPSTFTKKRLLILVSELVVQKPADFKLALLRLKGLIGNSEHPPLLVCKPIEASTSFRTVNSVFFDENVLEIVGNAEYKVRRRNSDFVVSNRLSTNCFEYSDLITLIRTELGEFLTNEF